MSHQVTTARRRQGVLTGLTVLLLGVMGSAHATLGDTPGGAGLTHPAALHSAGALSSTKSQPYSTVDSITDGGTAVREFVGPDGQVFAVTWKGPLMPNLSTLLGEYFAQYTSPSALQPTTHSARFVRNDSLVVQSTGHMHAFSGIAYLPKKLPAGVTADNLQ